jgi:hypothetical protein
MKLDDDAALSFFVCIIAPILLVGGVLVLDENLKRQTFQKAYEKNMECRMKINQPNPAYVNIVCGNVPKFEDF